MSSRPCAIPREMHGNQITPATSDDLDTQLAEFGHVLTQPRDRRSSTVEKSYIPDGKDDIDQERWAQMDNKHVRSLPPDKLFHYFISHVRRLLVTAALTLWFAFFRKRPTLYKEVCLSKSQRIFTSK